MKKELTKKEDMELAELNKKSRGCLIKLFAVAGSVISIIFLLNLTAGIIEIPDNLPIIGNLDEVAATTFLFYCLNILGLNPFPFLRGKK